MGTLIIIYLAVWIPLLLAGRRLGRAWGNLEAGTWLPGILGPFGFAVFIAAAHPALQPRRR